MTTPNDRSDLEARIAGLEAMLCDGQKEIGELRAENERLRAENERLDTELGDAVDQINLIGGKLDFANAELKKRNDALRPFADKARQIETDHDPVEIIVSLRDLRRAAELVRQPYESPTLDRSGDLRSEPLLMGRKVDVAGSHGDKP